MCYCIEAFMKKRFYFELAEIIHGSKFQTLLVEHLQYVCKRYAVFYWIFGLTTMKSMNLKINNDIKLSNFSAIGVYDIIIYFRPQFNS